MHRHLRSCWPAPLLAIALCLAAFATPAAADTVYVVSKSTGGLFRFDSANPADTITVISGTGTFATPTALAIGPDGHLYVGETGDGVEVVPRIRRVVVTGSTATLSTVVTLTGTDQTIYGENGQLAPAAIAFRRPSDGGQMLVGRNPQAQSTGPVVQVTGWETETPAPTVANFTTGTALNSSPGLAVSASTGALYVSNSAYGGGGQSIAGQVEQFDASQDPAPFAGTVVPGSGGPITAFGPTGLVVSGSMLYTASTQSSSVYVTNLTSGSTGLLGQIDSLVGFDAGPLARLSNGDLLTGSVIGFNPSLYLIPAAGTPELLDPFFSYNDFGSIGGIAVVPVPEPTALGLAAMAALGLGWRCARRRSRRA